MRRLGLALLVVAPPLVACGSAVSAADSLANAETKTSKVATARFTMSASVDEGKGPFTFTAAGVIAQRGDVMDMHLHVPATQGDSAFNGEVLIPAGHTLYMRAAEFNNTLPAGKHWVSIKDDDPQFNIGQNDPTQFLSYLRAVGTVEKVGTDLVRGSKTTHYKAAIDLDKVAKRIPTEDRTLIEPIFDALKRAGSRTIPIEGWVDEDGYVRRIKFYWSVRNPDKPSDRFAIRLRMNLFDFGAHVTVPKPTPAEVVPVEQLLNEGG